MAVAYRGRVARTAVTLHGSGTLPTVSTPARPTYIEKPNEIIKCFRPRLQLEARGKSNKTLKTHLVVNAHVKSNERHETTSTSTGGRVVEFLQESSLSEVTEELGGYSITGIAHGECGARTCTISAAATFYRLSYPLIGYRSVLENTKDKRVAIDNPLYLFPPHQGSQKSFTLFIPIFTLDDGMLPGLSLFYSAPDHFFQEFLKHIYAYFVPDNPVSKDLHTTQEKNFNMRPGPVQNLIPVYNNQGKLVRFIETSQDDELVGHKPPKIPVSMSTENVTSSDAKYIPSALYTHAPDGTLAKVSAPSTLSAGVINWDGWPTGIFEHDFTYKECEETSGLRVHWATRVNGGDRKGNEYADSWENGKKSSRTCLGVIECDNPMCSIVVRPHTKAASLDKQLRTPCKCSAVLSHRECDVMSYLWKWKGGVHYSNNGFHTHRRPTHILHLLPNELRRFEELVKAYPKSGPLQLIVGVPGLEGPGESVADISDVLLNAGRVSKEKQKFARDHPNFVIHSQFDEATVISVQTNFMRSQLVKESRLEGPVNGMVNDAAHGWWKERNSLLMVSSTYCPDLLCWVPGVMSFTNGATEEHFEHHFLAVMQSIAREAESRGMDIIDDLFAGTIYTYDDTKYRGSPVQEADAHFETHMAGRGIRLNGFVVWQVFYFLRGGLDAQKSFFMHRTQALKDKFDLKFSTTNLDQLPSVNLDSDSLVELPAQARNWLFNPFKLNTKEYVSELNPDDNISEDLGLESEDTMDPQDDLLPADLDCTKVGKSYYHFTEARPHLADQGLSAGRGALSRVGEYWYPIRLIERTGPTTAKAYQWRVEWWREIIFPADISLVPGNISLVNETEIIDSLWLKQKERRGIRLGRWKHAYEVETSEDILADPSRVPYSADVDTALSPFKDTLKLLLEQRVDELGDKVIPAKNWLERNVKSPLFSTLMPYVGSLSIIERAQISNWFDIHIGKRSKKARLAWLGYLPLAHAHTLYISQRLQRSPETALSHTSLLHHAWDILYTGISERIIDVDVAKECLYILEEEMFEVSTRAGKAGFFQWGLDAGHHQDGWDVYANLPPQFNRANYKGNDEDLEPGPDFIEYVPPIKAVNRELIQKPRPRPRPIKKAAVNKEPDTD
ncbi:hypothetical protein CPB84DRAFT_1746080 [Gymnopilus junonius]|uniref:Uncharacterized protein n=1 Tax=Gymnopilus junonius TaxID=109634 RepID=A0A9P5TPQ5_GYMJU|nr:hypothetical protein CPB84DRAFT_1746080 [Gymnopilus junonius]